MSYESEKLEFYNVAGRNGLDRDRCRDIIRHAQALELSNLRQCNEEMDDDAVFRLELEDAEHKDAVRSALSGTHIKVGWSGDPRGFAVRLLFPDGSYNTWGGKEHGYGVPTRPITLRKGGGYA